jgi:cobalt/nickel transport system ATP-binding protein
LVFQNPDVQLFNPTVFDEVAFGPLQMGWSSSEVSERVNSALETMGVVDLRDRAPYRLSGGEKKRVALASVIVLDPEVLLLDEPTSMLDPRSQSQLIDLIQNWKATSKTVVTATHQLEIVEDIAERVVVLEQGSVTAEGTPSEILSNSELLLRANLVHAHRHRHGDMVHSHPHLHSHAKHEQ